MLITIDDIRKAGICAAGARRWFPQHGLSFSDFLRDGIPSERLLSAGDDYARRVVAAKLMREYPDG